MADKIFAKIDLSKIDKSKIVTETYRDRNDVEHTSKRIPIEIIALKVPQVLSGKMMKTHFIVLGQTKEEREAKVKSVSLGDGIMFNNSTTDDDF